MGSSDSEISQSSIIENSKQRFKVDSNCGTTNKLRTIVLTNSVALTAQKKKFSIKDFSSICDQIRRKLRI